MTLGLYYLRSRVLAASNGGDGVWRSGRRWL